MLYYSFLLGYVKNYVGDRKLQLFVSIVICLVVGVFFYYIEQPITRSLTNELSAKIKKYLVGIKEKEWGRD